MCLWYYLAVAHTIRPLGQGEKMLIASIILIVVGALAVLGAFVFAAWNMFSTLSSKEWSLFGVFGKHLGAMIVMAVGGLVSGIGTILLIVALVLMFV